MKTIISVAAMAVLTAACSSNDKNSAGQDSPLAVDVAYPAVDSVTIYKEYPAQLQALTDVAVVARVSGNITAKHFTDGQYVRKGDALFSIDDTQFRDAVTQAQAALETAIAQTDYATRQYAAMQKALESDAVSRMEVEQAKSAMNQGNASIKNARAALSNAQTNLGYCTVRALSSGHISAATADIGDFVTAGTSPLATIYDDSALNAEFGIEDISYLKLINSPEHPELKNVPVTLADSLDNNIYTGSLTYVAPDVDPSTGTITLKLRIDNANGTLKSGMYANVYLPVEVVKDALLVKDSSTGSSQFGRYLYTLNDSDKVEFTQIEIGDLYHDSLRIVKSGITPGTRYVTKALLKVRPGMAVKPIVEKQR